MGTTRELPFPTLFLLSFHLLIHLAGGSGVTQEQDVKCQPIKVDLCARLGYNRTGMPNFIGHKLQSDAKAALETFSPLIGYKCSPDLLLFLCSVHAPACVTLPPTGQTKEAQNQLIGPCRPMCERVKRACLPILTEFRFKWPEALTCSRFPPSNNHEHMCLDGGGGENTGLTDSQEWLLWQQQQHSGGAGGAGVFKPPQIPAASPPRKELNGVQPHYPDLIRQAAKDGVLGGGGGAGLDPYLQVLWDASLHNMKPAKGFSGSCGGVVFPVHHHYVNRTDRCVPKCGVDILFEKEDKDFAYIWLLVWSLLCLLTTSFTLLTFLLDTRRFLYPEKCIIFLNLSYNILSIGYLVRLATGLEGVACTSPATSIPGEPRLLVTQGLSPSPACTVVFIILYFTSLSAAVWWAVTTTTWTVLLFTGIQVESLEARSPVFHLVGWGLPALQTVAALVLNQIEGDELTGICLPGQQTETTLLHQLIIPHAILLGSASLFFVCGVVASLVTPGEKTRKLLARIGIFSIFYTLPQVCVLGSLVYEYIERPLWRRDTSHRPVIEVFMMRIAMWLVVGIISGSWVWSHRTIILWRNLCSRCGGFWSMEKKPPTPVFPHVAYKAAPDGDTKENVITLDNLATLRRARGGGGGGGGGGEVLLGDRGPVPLAGHLPYSIDNNRIIL